MSSGRLSVQSLGLNYSPSPDEQTLACIMDELESLDRNGVRFSSASEDWLLAIEKLARKLRRKL